MSNFKDLVRIGKDAVTRYTQAGKPVTSFSAAFDNGYGDNKQTLWLDVSAWGERYEKLATNLTKGTAIVAEGDIGTREHDGKTYLTLKLSDFKFAGGKSDGHQGSQPRQQERPQRQAPQPAPMDDFADDDIPF